MLATKAVAQGYILNDFLRFHSSVVVGGRFGVQRVGIVDVPVVIFLALQFASGGSE